MHSSQQPIKILQVVGGMNRAGVETWLMHILRNIDRARFQMDFLVHSDEPGSYDEEIRSLGSRILCCLNPHNPIAYGSKFLALQQKYGPYDVVHSHVHAFSGYVTLLAKIAGVPRRVVHSHLDTTQVDAGASLFRRTYLAICRRWIQRHATEHLYVSEIAAASLFGVRWSKAAELLP